MEKRGVLTLSEEAARQIGDATVRMARAVEELPEGAKLSARQQEVYRVLREAGPVSVREVCYFTGVTPAVVTALVKKGGAELFEQEVYRSPLEAVDLPDTPEKIRLTQEQEAAFQSLYAQYREGKGGVLPAVWRHRQRQDPGVPATDRPSPRGGPGRYRHGARKFL